MTPCIAYYGARAQHGWVGGCVCVWVRVCVCVYMYLGRWHAKMIGRLSCARALLQSAVLRTTSLSYMATSDFQAPAERKSVDRPL
jgi:hypothetical protein